MKTTAMASSSISPWNTLDERVNERETLIRYLPQFKNIFPRLSSVKSCAMIGCGYGKLDVEFVRECLPNVAELAAVEPDADQMAVLKIRLAQLFPTVSVDFFQDTAQSWKGAGKPFEVVLLFHCLYFLSPSELAALFKKLFDDVVASGGHIFVLHNTCTSEDPARLFRLHRLLSGQSEVDGAQLCEMMTSAGYRSCYELHMKCQLDVEKLDEFAAWYAYVTGCTLSSEVIHKAAEEVFGGRKTVPHDNWFGAFRKP